MGARPFSPRTAPAAEPARNTPRVAPADADSKVLRRGREAAALCLFAVALFLALSLASYRCDPYDPGMRGSDWMGPVGAGVVGFLVQGFGLVAWLMPLELALIGAPLLKGRAGGPLGVRLFGDLIVAIILAALIRVSAPELLVFGRAPAPGNVGMVFGELMRGLFSAPGSFLVGATAVGLILIGRSSFSFIRACRRAGEIS